MLFFLSTSKYNNTQANTTRVKVHLRNGVAEIYDKHQDLMGKVENNLVEVETNFENKIEKSLFIVQEGVFVVSNKGLDQAKETSETSVYVYAKRAQEIGRNFDLEKLKAEFEEKTEALTVEIQKMEAKEKDPLAKIINSKAILLREDVEFLRRTILILGDLRLKKT